MSQASASASSSQPEVKAMTLTLEQLQDIQADEMADDLEIDFAKMSLWTEEEARTYFQTGDEPPPPWAPDPYFMRKLDENELGHLKEVIGKQEHGKLGTVAGLVALIREDRPKFLPTLKDLGIAKLPDRQTLRDVINAIANPPVGSEDNLRDEYKEELLTWPYANLQGEKYICKTDVETMVNEIPKPSKERVFRKYKVNLRPADKATGVILRRRRAQNGGAANGALPNLMDGEILPGVIATSRVHACNHTYLLQLLQSAAQSDGRRDPPR